MGLIYLKEAVQILVTYYVSELGTTYDAEISPVFTFGV